MKTTLLLTTENYINGFWDGGSKKYFKFNVNNINQDKKGFYAQVGSYEGNFYFHLSAGINKKQTDKQILKNALKTNYLMKFIKNYNAKWEIIQE